MRNKVDQHDMIIVWGSKISSPPYRINNNCYSYEAKISDDYAFCYFGSVLRPIDRLYDAQRDLCSWPIINSAKIACVG